MIGRALACLGGALALACGAANPAVNDDSIHLPFLTVVPPAAPQPPAPCAPVHEALDAIGTIPDDIELSGDDSELWLADTAGSRVRRYALPGGAALTPDWVGGASLPWALTRAPDGAVLLATLNDGVVMGVGVPGGDAQTVLQGLQHPIELAFAAADRLLVAEASGSPARLTDGVLTEWMWHDQRASSPRRRLGSLPGAIDVALTRWREGNAIRGSDDVYVIAGGMAQVWRLAPDDTTAVVARHVTAPTDIAFHPHTGGLLVSAERGVVWVDPYVGTTVRLVCDDAQIQRAEDMAVAADGTVYLSDALAARVVQFKPTAR